MLAKTAFDKILSRIRSGAVEINYWDSETKVYGQGKPYFKIKIKDPKVIGAILKNKDLGFGEAYMAGTIELDGELDQLYRLMAENKYSFAKLARKLQAFKSQPNTKNRQPAQVSHHYDLGNDFYRSWLDKTMTYTCAYYRTPEDTLEQAQTQKIDHVLRKLQLQKGQTFLDIGCGWGHLVIRGAKKYGASGLGVTLSREQYKYATKMAKDEGMEKLARFEHLNYQDLLTRDLQFDRVISVGVLEHVGRGNLHQYFDVVNHVLKPGGVSVLHSITAQEELPLSPWLDKYIFPGAYVQSLRQIISLMPDYNFYLTDYESLRYHYYLTCYAWLQRFDALKDEVIKTHGEEFYRMWRFYLACCGSSFHYGMINLSQLVFTKGINNDLPLTREFLYP